MQAGRVLILFLFTSSVVQGQSPYKQSGGPAQGSLRVTVTVEPSVWLRMGPDGKQEMVVANAPDPKESFFHVPSQTEAKQFEVKQEIRMMDVNKGGKAGRQPVKVTTVVSR